MIFMNESNQPFTDHVTRAKSSSKAGRLAWVAAVIAGALAISFGVLWGSARAREHEEVQALQNNLDETKSALTSARSEVQTNQDEIAALKEQIAGLQKQKQQVTQTSKTLEDEMRSQLESKDVTISKLQGKLTVNILDNVMFDSGEAVLKPDGETVMKKIAAILKEHSQLVIQVVGHTDNVPIRPTAHTRFASNWELSTARALAAVHFLTEQSGVDPRRVSAAGYGEFHPVADNSTAEGRAKNRRIAITILPDEFAPTDPAPAANSATQPTTTPKD
jgi:chemotaxis protein MotB